MAFFGRRRDIRTPRTGGLPKFFFKISNWSLILNIFHRFWAAGGINLGLSLPPSFMKPKIMKILKIPSCEWLREGGSTNFFSKSQNASKRSFFKTKVFLWSQYFGILVFFLKKGPEILKIVEFLPFDAKFLRELGFFVHSLMKFSGKIWFETVMGEGRGGQINLMEIPIYYCHSLKIDLGSVAVNPYQDANFPIFWAKPSIWIYMSRFHSQLDQETNYKHPKHCS